MELGQVVLDQVRLNPMGQAQLEVVLPLQLAAALLGRLGVGLPVPLGVGVDPLEVLHLPLVQQEPVVLQAEVDLAVAQMVPHQQGVAAPSLQLHRQLAMTVEPLLFLHLVKRLVPLILEAPQLGMV